MASLVLGIETSCDETAAAVVAEGRVVLSNVVASQAALHAPYGGVFPELASRQHVRDIVPVIQQALTEAGAVFDDLAAVAVTHGPGLAGSLLVGVNAAKGICLASGLPLIGVNHMNGHLYSNWLHDRGTLRTPVSRPDWRALRPAGPGAPWPGDPPFPLLLLTVSGGHTELLLVRGHGDFSLLGQTLDDAAGEAFDKAARMLGLGYPGGPAIQQAAEEARPLLGDASSHPSRASMDTEGSLDTVAALAAAAPFPVADTSQALDFSFSGLKTAMRRRVEAARAGGRELEVSILAAGFQAAVVRALVGRARRALDRHPEARVLLLAGGVAANGPLRAALASAIDRPVFAPPLELCTDNAAMIAAAGHFAAAAGRRDGLDLDVVAGLGWD